MDTNLTFRKLVNLLVQLPLTLHQVLNTLRQVLVIQQLPVALHQVPKGLLDDGEHHSLPLHQYRRWISSFFRYNASKHLRNLGMA